MLNNNDLLQNPYSYQKMEVAKKENMCFCSKSYFRILNAVVGAPAIDIYINEMIVASNLKFSEFSRYMKFMPGEYKIVIFPSGKYKEAIFETVISIDRNFVYNGIFAGDMNNDSEIVIYMVPASKENQIMNQMSTVKIINMVQNTKPLELVTSEGTILFSSVGYGCVTCNVTLPSGIYALSLRTKETSDNILNVPSIDFVPNMFYTLFLIGDYGKNKGLTRIEMIIPEEGLNYLDIC